MPLLRFAVAMLLLTGPARADALRVAVDIAPVHSLVAQVMQGLGAPDLIVTPGASPHGYALRPSQARALQAADLVVWVGPGLTPWLVKPVETLAAGADKLELLGAQGTHTVPFREDAGGGEDHDDHGHDAHNKNESEDQGHDHEGGIDPHAWLDPQNAHIWLGLIAEHLARADPENAARYHANATASQAALSTLVVELTAQLTPMKSRPYVTFHDAYQYFEARFGLTPVGTVSLSDATAPSPASLAHLRDILAQTGVTCAFSEPQFDPALLHVAVGKGATILPLDPMGSRLSPGAELYGDMLRDMGAAFATCASQN